MSDISPNYDYCIDTAARLLPSGGRVLDFGCGTGTILVRAAARAPSLEFWGADTFAGIYAQWQAKLPEAIKPRVRPIVDGKLPFEDGSFDVVIANQVFEHVEEPAAVLAEIARLLRPGGYFLALFPTAETWFEGHSGVYFAHWIRDPVRQKRYLAAARKLGFGYYPGTATPDAWADKMGRTLRQQCYFRTGADIGRLWRAAFGASPASLEADYIRYRLAVHPRFGRLAPLAKSNAAEPLLATLCRLRAGCVLLSRKPPSG